MYGCEPPPQALAIGLDLYMRFLGLCPDLYIQTTHRHTNNQKHMRIFEMPRCSHSGHRHTVSQVLSNVSKRLAVMHDAGYVHRDLKPANVMWLPRENRWTVIDFGCVAGIGKVAPLSFTLAYAPPEVVRVHEAGGACLEVTAALDAWSLGVMAFELLTGAPAFKFLTEGRAKVRTHACMPYANHTAWLVCSSST